MSDCQRHDRLEQHISRSTALHGLNRRAPMRPDFDGDRALIQGVTARLGRGTSRSIDKSVSQRGKGALDWRNSHRLSSPIAQPQTAAAPKLARLQLLLFALRLLLFRSDHTLSVIVAALRAHGVRQGRAAALGARDDGLGLLVVVRTTLTGLGIALSSLGDSHGQTPLRRPALNRPTQ